MELKTRIKELAKQAADFSRQGVDIMPEDFHQGKNLMRQAREASRRCQVLIQELKRQRV